MIDEGLKQFATKRQAEYIDAINEHGTQEKAAKALKINLRSLTRALAQVKKIAASKGFSPDHDMTHIVPDGFNVKGVSSYYDIDGNLKAQWVKSNVDRDKQIAIMREFIESIAEDIRGLHEPVIDHKEHLPDDTLSAYIMGDAHIGMYAWAEECGDDFDSDIAVRDIKAAVDYLVNAQPASNEGLLVNVGDFLHMDNRSNATPASGNLLDVDSRYSRVIRIAMFALRYCVARLLEKHNIVRVINAAGNHDPDSTNWISLALSMYYERDNRVIIDESPAKFHFHQFGKCLIGVTHGDRIKHDDLPSIMAAKVPEKWGVTEHRYWFTGHIHHKRQTEYRGCIVESFNTLAASDSFHESHGYMSKREMQALTLHRQHGIIARAQCPIDLIRLAS